MTSKSKYIVAVIFLVFIGIFAVLLWVVPKENFSPREKRYLQTFPQVSFKNLTDGSFETDFESYVNDHMVMRDVFMGINSYSNLAMLNNGSSGVYYCKDEYLINDPAENTRLDLNLSVVSDFKDKTKIDTSLMIVPSTGYIMADNLPKVHLDYKDDRYFKTIKEYSREHDLTLIDLRNTFKTNKNNQQIYYRTDHHWTTTGAYLAYNQLCANWGITPASRDKFTAQRDKNFYGTTYNTSALWLTKPDTLEVWKNPENKVTCEITANGKATKYDTMFFDEQLKGEDKYSVFLNGNNPVTVIKSKTVKNGKNLLVVKDSFSHSLAPFLAENFENITLVDMRYYKKSVSEEICSKEHFDKLLICMSIDNFLEDRDFAFLE